MKPRWCLVSRTTRGDASACRPPSSYARWQGGSRPHLPEHPVDRDQTVLSGRIIFDDEEAANRPATTSHAAAWPISSRAARCSPIMQEAPTPIYAPTAWAPKRVERECRRSPVLGERRRQLAGLSGGGEQQQMAPVAWSCPPHLRRPERRDPPLRRQQRTAEEPRERAEPPARREGGVGDCHSTCASVASKLRERSHTRLSNGKSPPWQLLPPVITLGSGVVCSTSTTLSFIDRGRWWPSPSLARMTTPLSGPCPTAGPRPMTPGPASKARKAARLTSRVLPGQLLRRDQEVAAGGDRRRQPRLVRVRVRPGLARRHAHLVPAGVAQCARRAR